MYNFRQLSGRVADAGRAASIVGERLERVSAMRTPVRRRLRGLGYTYQYEKYWKATLMFIARPSALPAFLSYCVLTSAALAAEHLCAPLICDEPPSPMFPQETSSCSRRTPRCFPKLLSRNIVLPLPTQPPHNT